MQYAHELYKSSPVVCAFAQFCEQVLSVHAARQLFSAVQSALPVHAFAADAQVPAPVDSVNLHVLQALAPAHVPFSHVSPLAHAWPQLPQFTTHNKKTTHKKPHTVSS